MKVISLIDGLGLTKGRLYEVIEESAGYYKVELDDGNISFRISNLFEKNVLNEKFPYVIGQSAEICHNGTWKKGKIIAGYRFRDGIVTIRTDSGETVWCGEARKELYRPLVE